MIKRVVRALGLLLIVALALASCELPTAGSDLSLDGAAGSKGLTSSKVDQTKIYCTASLPPECFFFEFDLYGAKKEARVLLPLSGGSYIKDGKVKYKAEEYDLVSLYYDPSTGALAGQTAVRGGLSYSFQGSYAPAQGFFGYITKTEAGVSTTGMMGGVPASAGKKLSYYVGEATYLFQTPTPQTLLFGAAVDSSTGTVYGTWCESGVGWPYSIHGSIGGTADAKAIHITALPFPEFQPYLLYEMSAAGEGIYKNRSKKDVSGTFNITYGGMLLPSLLTAAQEID